MTIELDDDLSLSATQAEQLSVMLNSIDLDEQFAPFKVPYVDAHV